MQAVVGTIFECTVIQYCICLKPALYTNVKGLGWIEQIANSPHRAHYYFDCHLLGYTYPLNSISRHFGSLREAPATVDAECSCAGGGGCHLSSCQLPFAEFLLNLLSFQICWEGAQLIAFQAFPTKSRHLTKTTCVSLAHCDKFKKPLL